MKTFAEEDHPRAVVGTFIEKRQSAPEIGALTRASLLDVTRLSQKERIALNEHLAGTTEDGRSIAELYQGKFVSVSQQAAWGSRGMPPELAWHLHPKVGLPFTVPDVVAKAATVPDATDPLVPLKHNRDKARVAMVKAVDERARRSGRSSREAMEKLRGIETRATERFLILDVQHTTAVEHVAARGLANLLSTRTAFATQFNRDMALVVGRDAVGEPAAPLADRIAAQRKVLAAAAAESARAVKELESWRLRNGREYVFGKV